MAVAKARHLVVFLAFVAFIAIVNSDRNFAVLEMLKDGEDMRSRAESLQSGDDGSETFEAFIQLVRGMKEKPRDFSYGWLRAANMMLRGRQHDRERYEAIYERLFPDSGESTQAKTLYWSKSLESIDQSRRNAMREILGMSTRPLQIDRLCQGIARLRPELQEQRISINHVCSSLRSCATVARPFSSGRAGRQDDDLTRACTSDNKCNVAKALPLMAALFYSKVYEVASDYACCRSNYDYCIYSARSATEMRVQSDVLVAYAYSHPVYWNLKWGSFFGDMVANSAFVDMDVAVSIMEEKRHEFEYLQVICRILEYVKACAHYEIYKQYMLIKTSQQNRNRPTYVKDLRLYRQVDHAKLIELQSIKLSQIEILGSVKSLDENLQASVSGISTFFRGLAKFDQGIADADAAFVSGELEKYNTTLSQVQEKLNEDLEEAMGYMIAVIGARLAEKITVLGLKIATNCNPLKLIFSGPDLADIASLANEVADAGADLAKAVALITTSLTELGDDSEKFANAFIGNSEQLSAVESLKEQILAGHSNSLNQDAEKFLEQYSAYTPQTDRSSLARNDALWSAFKDATCDFLSTDSGVLSAIPKGIAGAKLLCERLEGTLAQYFTLREDIFDFQFQLIEAMAGIVRGNLARGLAENIQENTRDVMSGAQLLSTFFLVQNNLQTVASTFCDVIEYKQLGQPLSGCAMFRGLFRKENLDAMIAYNPSSITHHEVERFVTIPSHPSYPGDMAYIDLNGLAMENEVVFHVPKNRTWLEENRWTIPGQSETEVPFVKEFEIYLPHKSYESGSIPSSSTMEVTIKSIAGSYISTLNPNTGVSYLLPRGSATYLTSYEENYASCSKEIKNPYSLCDNLPKVCVLSSRHPRDDALLPTTLSTWLIRLRRTQGSSKLTWEAPHTSTNFSLSARLVLQAPSLRKKKIASVRSDVVNSENGCCENNRYRANRMVNRECVTCPAGSTALLRGLYCEIDQEPESHVKAILPRRQKKHYETAKSAKGRAG